MLEAETEAKLQQIQQQLTASSITTNDLLALLHKSAPGMTDHTNANPLNFVNSLGVLTSALSLSAVINSNSTQMPQPLGNNTTVLNMGHNPSKLEMFFMAQENKRACSVKDQDIACDEFDDLSHQIMLEKCLKQVFDEQEPIESSKSSKSAQFMDDEEDEENKPPMASAMKPICLNSSVNRPSGGVQRSIVSFCSSPLSKENNHLNEDSITSPIAANKINQRSSNHTNSTSSLSSQPSSFNSSGQKSSIMLYRSLNTSNTIYVQPSDIIIPLVEGDYNEYKLFPHAESSPATSQTTNNKDEQNSIMMGKLLNNLGVKCYNGQDSDDDLDLVDTVYSPPLSSISSNSSSGVNSVSSSLNASPISTSPSMLMHHHHIHHCITQPFKVTTIQQRHPF